MKSENIPDILRLASIISVAFPLVVYVLKARNVSRPVHLIGALIIISALFDLAGGIYFSKGESTVVLFNSYYIIQFAILAWFYYSIHPLRTGRVTAITGIILYILAFILVTTYSQSFFTYQTLLWTISGMIMIVCSISYFVYLFGSQTVTDNYGYLWVNGGILYYFSFNLFLFIMSSYVLTKLEPQLGMLIWSFHNANNIIKNILIGLGILSFTKERTL
jgi:hypothetical protein